MTTPTPTNNPMIDDLITSTSLTQTTARPVMTIQIWHDDLTCASGGEWFADTVEPGERVRHLHTLRVLEAENGTILFSTRDRDLLTRAFSGGGSHSYSAEIRFSLADHHLEGAGREAEFRIDPTIVFSVKDQVPGIDNCEVYMTLVTTIFDGDEAAVEESKSLANEFLEDHSAPEETLMSSRRSVGRLLGTTISVLRGDCLALQENIIDEEGQLLLRIQVEASPQLERPQPAYLAITIPVVSDS